MSERERTESNTQTSWMRQRRKKVATHTPVAAGCHFCAAPAGNKSRRQSNLPWGPPIDCAHKISISGLFFWLCAARRYLHITARLLSLFRWNWKKQLLFQWSSLIRFECIMPTLVLFLSICGGSCSKPKGARACVPEYIIWCVQSTKHARSQGYK